MTTDAEKYALDLAKALHAKHYADVTQWKPLEGDLIGLLTQIDNMTASLALAPQVKETPPPSSHVVGLSAETAKRVHDLLEVYAPGEFTLEMAATIASAALATTEGSTDA